MIHLYGIPNCDTVKKARTWLDRRGVEYTFHDYKKEGADKANLGRWADRVGWEVLLNRRGTTFRALDEGEKVDIDRAKAIALMLQHPSLIKRPVAEHEEGERILVGFAPSEWENAWC